MRYRRSRAGATFFFTVVTHEREKILCGKENILLINEAFEQVGLKYPFAVDAFVFLPDHIHCLWTLPENDNDYSRRWRLIKSYFSKQCQNSHARLLTPSRLRKGEQAFWQRRFWEHTIVDEADFVSHVDYIHYNPVKHGLANSPKDWPYSSFHRYVREGVYEMDWAAGNPLDFKDNVGRE